MGGRPVPRWVQTVTVAAVSVVALVAATASYAHVHTLADRAGEGWRAFLSPLSVDGLLVAASMVMLVRRRAGLAAGVLPWAGLVLGLGASLGANVAASHPEWRTPLLDGFVSAWPAIALAISFELLILVVREHGTVRATVADAVGSRAPELRPGRVDPPSVPDAPTPAAAAKPQRTEAQRRAAAQRAARSRRHKTGDHSLCLPGRCPDAAPRVRAVR